MKKKVSLINDSSRVLKDNREAEHLLNLIHSPSKNWLLFQKWLLFITMKFYYDESIRSLEKFIIKKFNVNLK